MTTRGRVVGAVAGAAGLAAAATALGVARQRRVISGRRDDPAPFGSLHSRALTVVADDGVALHVEVDEVDPGTDPGPEPGTDPSTDPGTDRAPITLVFSHGYCLNLDCWHFQRAAYRGLVRAVYYDQRSHGRSGRSPAAHATIEQLGADLLQVIEAVAPDGPVVLVGHSMGGMSIIALVEAHPELVGDKIVGAALISTTAGGLDPSRLILPMLPAKLSGGLTARAVRTLARGHRLVDVGRRLGHSVAMVATDLFAFGDAVPPAYVEFVDTMLSATPFEVVADFFPSFRGLDKFDCVERLGQVPTTVICGTADRLTSIGHSRKLHARIPGSTLLECEDAGHLVILERHEQVDAALDQLVSAATQAVGPP